MGLKCYIYTNTQYAQHGEYSRIQRKDDTHLYCQQNKKHTSLSRKRDNRIMVLHESGQAISHSYEFGEGPQHIRV